MARTRASTAPQAGGAPTPAPSALAALAALSAALACAASALDSCPSAATSGAAASMSRRAHTIAALDTATEPVQREAERAPQRAGANASTRAQTPRRWDAAPRLGSLSAVCAGGNRSTENLSSGSVDHPYAVRTAVVSSSIVAGVPRTPRL
jgi:hypothetical protein